MKHHERLQEGITRLKEKLTQANSEIRQLRRSLDTANALLMDIPVAVAIVQNGKIVLANKAAEEGLGLDAGQLQDRSFMDFVHPDCAKEVSTIHYKRSMGKVAPDRYQAELLDKDRRRFLCEVFVRKILHMGRRAFLLGVIDCGERSLGDSERLRNERVSGAMDLAKAVVRELSPLMEMFLDKMAGRAQGGVQPRRLPGDFSEPVQQGLGALRQLEKLCRAEAVGMENHLQDIKDLIQDALDEARLDWQQRKGSQSGGPRIQTHLRTDARVQGDRVGLKEAFAAVIENAIEAVGENGEVHVSTEESLGHVCVYVLDNGPGISEALRERVFEPFFTTREGGRFGLGLPLASCVFKRHGGGIELASRPGGGTQVVMQLPAAAAAKSVGSRGCFSRLKGQRILIWSDEVMIRHLLREVLESKGCRVTVVSHLQEVLRVHRKGRHEVLVMDADPKEADPLIMLPKLREKDLETILVILKTKGRQPGKALLKDLGADLIAFKPLHMDGLMRAITASLGREVRPI